MFMLCYLLLYFWIRRRINIGEIRTLRDANTTQDVSAAFERRQRTEAEANPEVRAFLCVSELEVVGSGRKRFAGQL